uniref:Myosin motor domain-containing protein n=1 Tax=Syphacia muris TaxID=451379 RepID=A0A0N5A9Z8_9BILA
MAAHLSHRAICCQCCVTEVIIIAVVVVVVVVVVGGGGGVVMDELLSQKFELIACKEAASVALLKCKPGAELRFVHELYAVPEVRRLCAQKSKEYLREFFSEAA